MPQLFRTENSRATDTIETLPNAVSKTSAKEETPKKPEPARRRKSPRLHPRPAPANHPWRSDLVLPGSPRRDDNRGAAK